MKNYCLSLLTLVLSVFLFSSCGDDTIISPDTNKAITGVWQVGDRDINYDGAITGITVHDDGTVTEWQYKGSAQEPFSFGYKNGRWSASGNHYELQLSRGDGSFYTVTVAGNDDNEMYLAYNGKTSVVPMRRLTSMPGDGDNILRLLETMKFSAFTIADLTGYWEYAEDNSQLGLYIDAEGNVSDVSPYFSVQASKMVNYHSGQVKVTSSSCSFPLKGSIYTVYALDDHTMLATIDGKKVDRFVRKDIPQEVTELDEQFNAPVSSTLVGTWELVHYTQIAGGHVSTDVDITPSDQWAMQFYRKLVFTADHQLRIYTYHSGDTYNSMFFTYGSDMIKMATTPGELFSSVLQENSIWKVESISGTELKIKENNREVYTYRKIN